jgi:hypothetical protein
MLQIPAVDMPAAVAVCHPHHPAVLRALFSHLSQPLLRPPLTV